MSSSASLESALLESAQPTGDLAFLFVVLGVTTVLEMITSSAVALTPIDTALAIYAPIYCFLAMRRVYGQGWWLTLGKLSALGTAYLVLCGVVVVATISFSFLTL